MPPVGNLYLNGGNRPKRVENPGAAFGKSLPKQRIFLIWVEISDAAVRESLPKQREIGEKGRESRCQPVGNLYPKGGNRPKRVENPGAAG